MNWYSNLYRRHLCDMHIDDWDPLFLSEFSPRAYVEALKTAKINHAMIYLQAHTGLCYYPTRTGVMHKALIGREDLLKKTVDLCHENGIKVMGYYSLIHNTREHDRHPEWRMIRVEGCSSRERGKEGEEKGDAKLIRAARYGFCCLNNKEYTDFVYQQTDEMLEYFDVDGIFYDMPFWPHICYCEDCKARYRKETGRELPASKPIDGTEEYYALYSTYYRWMGEWVQGITDHLKAISPETAVEYNFAHGIAGDSRLGCGEEVNAASDFSGGDLYGGIRSHSFTCKFYKNITKNAPFEYMFSRAKPGLSSHTLTKTLDEMKTAIGVTMAHHGATFVIDAIDPVGTLDTRIYERIGQMFDYQIPYEPYFRGEMAEDIGIYYSLKSRVDVYGEGRGSIKSCVALSDTLIAKHIPFGITGTFRSLEGYRALFAPYLSEMAADDNERLISYVENGGTLYLSGGGNRALVETLTGGVLDGSIEETSLYVAPKPAYLGAFGGFNEKYPLPYKGRAPILTRVAPADVAATFTLPYTRWSEMRYVSIHSNPPMQATEIPALVIRKYGKGTVIWSAAPIECGGTEEYGEILWNLMSDAAGISDLSFMASAPANVELTLFGSADEKLLSAVVLSDAGAAYPIAPFTARVRCETAPRAVTLLPEGKPVKYTYKDGYVSFRTRKLNIFDMYRIEL